MGLDFALCSFTGNVRESSGLWRSWIAHLRGPPKQKKGPFKDLDFLEMCYGTPLHNRQTLRYRLVVGSCIFKFKGLGEDEHIDNN